VVPSASTPHGPLLREIADRLVARSTPNVSLRVRGPHHYSTGTTDCEDYIAGLSAVISGYQHRSTPTPAAGNPLASKLASPVSIPTEGPPHDGWLRYGGRRWRDGCR